MRGLALLGVVAGVCGCDSVFGLSRPPIDSGTMDAVDASLRVDCSDPALRLCMRFEDDFGDSIADDSSGQMNHATITLVSPIDRRGQQAAKVIDGSGIVIVEDESLDVVDPMTVEMWFYLEVAPVGGASSLVLDNDGQYAIFVATGNILYCSASREGTQLRTSQSTNTGTWHHVACVHEQNPFGAQSTMYLDGVQVSQNGGTGALDTNGGSGMQIGQNAGAGNTTTLPLIGAVDNVRVWAKALTVDEILAIVRND